MNCDDALVALVDQDLTGLHDDPATPLGRHLADCVRCRRVASQLAADSILLARAVRAPLPGTETRHPRAMPWLVGGTLAAASVAGVFLWGRGGTVDSPAVPVTTPAVEVATILAVPEQSTTVAVAPSSTPRVTAPRPATRPMRVPTPTPVSRSPTPGSVTAEPEPAAAPVRVLPAEPVAPVVATPYRAVAIGATPPPPAAGMSDTDPAPAPTGTILRTSNPNIIVVWHQTP